jgi:hypothetical protein
VTVVPFYPPRGRRVVTVATILDDPAKGLRCLRCRRRCARTIHGLGPRCARLLGLTFRARRPHEVEHRGPDLLDLLAEAGL